METSTEMNKLFHQLFKNEFKNGAKPTGLFQTPHEIKNLEHILFPDLVELESETVGDPYEISVPLLKTYAKSLQSARNCEEEDLEKAKESCKDVFEMYIKAKELDKLEKKRFESFKTTRDILLHASLIDDYRYGSGYKSKFSLSGDESSEDSDDNLDFLPNEIQKMKRNLSKIKNDKYNEKFNELLVNYNESVQEDEEDNDEDDDRVSLVDMENNKHNEEINDEKMYTDEDIEDINNFFSALERGNTDERNPKEEYESLRSFVLDNVPSHIDDIFTERNPRTESVLFTQVCKELEDCFSEPVVGVEVARKCFIDPLTKKPITVPLRNKICGHYYDKASIHILLSNRRSPCPYIGCSCKVFTMDDLEDPPECSKEIESEDSVEESVDEMELDENDD